jgi:hypothetical protein
VYLKTTQWRWQWEWSKNSIHTVNLCSKWKIVNLMIQLLMKKLPLPTELEIQSTSKTDDSKEKKHASAGNWSLVIHSVSNHLTDWAKDTKDSIMLTLDSYLGVVSSQIGWNTVTQAEVFYGSPQSATTTSSRIISNSLFTNHPSFNITGSEITRVQ